MQDLGYNHNRSFQIFLDAISEAARSGAEEQAMRAAAQLGFHVIGQNYCESPIESLALAAIMAGHARDVSTTLEVVNGKTGKVVKAGAGADDPIGRERQAVITLQMPVGPFRADIAYVAGRFSKTVVLECDGQDFHSDEEQIAADKARDQYFESQGLVVHRVSGPLLVRWPLVAWTKVDARANPDFQLHRRRPDDEDPS